MLSRRCSKDPAFYREFTNDTESSYTVRGIAVVIAYTDLNSGGLVDDDPLRSRTAWAVTLPHSSTTMSS